MITTAQERNRSTLWIIIYFLLLIIYIIAVFYYGITTQRPILGVLIILTFAPAFLFLLFFYFLGNRDKISTNRLLIANIFGIIFFIIAIIAEGLLFFIYSIIYTSIFPQDEDWLSHRYLLLLFLTGFVSFTIPALVEETAKFFILHCSCLRGKKKIHPIGLVILSMVGALVLATIENNEYIISSFNKFSNDNNGEDDAISVIVLMFLEILLRNLLSVPLHGFTGILIGCEYAKIIHSSSSVWRNIHRILVMPMVIHGLFDWSLLWAFESLQHGGSPFFYLLLLSPFFLILFSLYLVSKKVFFFI